MRHRKKLHHLARPSDQRNAIVRSLATALFTHDTIMTTLGRAKALRAYADRIVTLAKRGDLHAIRQVSRLIYNQSTGHLIDDTGRSGKQIEETVLRRIFRTVGPRSKERQGGYTRVVHAPPRRGDAAPMALVQLVD